MKKNNSNKNLNRNILIFILVIFLLIKGISWWKAENETTVNKRFQDSNLILTKHVKCRMDCRQITLEEIKEIIGQGKVNVSKSGIGSKGDSTFALEGFSHEKQHIRVVVAPENEGLVIITCIDLNKEWPCNCD
jgi:hypothetical protein